MEYITIYDYLLLPLYLFVFYFIVKVKSTRYPEADLRKFLKTAFFLRMFGSVAYSLIVQYYYGYGDSFTYYVGSSFFSDQILQDPGNIKYLFSSSADIKQWYDVVIGNIEYSGYFGIPSAAMIMKISAVLSFICFNKFLIISLFFGFFSFLGQWKLFLVFNDIAKKKNTKFLAWAVLYSPSICFWGSGLMKDSICLGALGFIFHIIYKIFVKKQVKKRDSIALIVLIYFVFVIKSYIILIVLASLILVFFIRYVFQIRNLIVRIAMICVFLFTVGLVAALTNLQTAFTTFIDDSYAMVEIYKTNYESVNSDDENSRGAIKLSDFDSSPAGLALKAPEVIFSCLYRPFLWESKKVIILFSALESTLLLLVTLYLMVKTRVVGFFSIIFSTPYILFCFTLSILFALIIGFTTFNFGTMARYKIMLLPFFYFMLLSIYNKITGEKTKTIQPGSSQ